ncbi:MAG: hypothetical protein H0V92_05695 [Pseudonocardiales bacterium]|nr:hypothetical protein [Pseudonocardiales bacterium]
MRGVARVDAVSFAKPETPVLAVPEAGGPASLGQVGPWAMTGQRWMADPTEQAPRKENAFHVIISGARAVTFDLPRMGISSGVSVGGDVTTARALRLSLKGTWPKTPKVLVGNKPVAATLSRGVLSVTLPAGTFALRVG